MIHHGDCLDIMPTLPAESIDSIVTDPPYGLSFMGKNWDHGIPGVAFWSEALRVAKPGSHLLAFGGTRTFHRLTCAIEDAGWEIRDCIMWVYGSGFPKSHNLKGDWQGWGTALKPAVEYIVVAQKPPDLQGICGTMALTIGDAICQLQSSANAASLNSTSSRSDFGVECGSALWSAAEKSSTPGGLCGLMGMSRSGMVTPSSLSIALSWLDTLGAVSTAANMFTTEMASSLITDLRILNSLPSKIMAESIAQAATGQRGIGSSASLAESIFNVVEAKLASILTPSAVGFATSKGENQALRPNWLPIIVARKPLVGTVAQNVQAYGTGAVNVDGCRVKFASDTDKAAAAAASQRACQDQNRNRTAYGRFENGPATISPYIDGLDQGRWPANLIHDGSDEVTGLMGDAARFFYCAKASKADRDEGCEGLALREVNRYSEQGQGPTPQQTPRITQLNRNHHPTVKPTDLMRYLCRLVTPPGGTVLDPFCGSGSTGKAATLEGFRFIGIEREAEYVEIAKARIAHARGDMPLLEALA